MKEIDGWKNLNDWWLCYRIGWLVFEKEHWMTLRGVASLNIRHS